MRAAGLHAEPVDPRIEAIVGQDWLARNALEVLKFSIDVLCRRAVFEVHDCGARSTRCGRMRSSSTRTAGAPCR